jgi:hypothetical protein
MTARSEIETRINTWAEAQIPPIPVAFEGVNFTKPASGPYLEVYMLGSDSKLRTVSADGVRELGMFQVNCYAEAGKGMGEVEAIGQSIVSLFPVLPKTGTVSIEQPLSWSRGSIIDGYAFVPVRGNYRIES